MNSYITTYYKQNKPIILLLLLWLFRICFLTQGNRGGVAINKYVVIQIIAILALGMQLLSRHYTPKILLKYNATKHFAILYIFGMISILWSVFPLMSCFFALENLVCMTAIMYLSCKCTNVYELEKFFIYAIIFIIGMFFIKTILITKSFHSVTYSSISAMLTMYCLPELHSRNRLSDNSKTLKIGLAVGIIILFMTTSGGAIFSTFLTFLVYLILSKKLSLRLMLFISLLLLGLLIFFGYHQVILNILFPHKSTTGILTAHGRTRVWDMINVKVAEKPLLGWGYAAVERILPIYCIDAHNSIIGIRGSLGNIGCFYLIFSMIYVLGYFYINRDIIGYKGIFFAVLCAFINSNTSNFLASKAGPCAITFQSLLVLGAAFHYLSRKCSTQTTQDFMISNLNDDLYE